LERFPQVEHALERLIRRGAGRAGVLGSLVSYFQRGFIPLSTPSRSMGRRGTAVIVDTALLRDEVFLDLLDSFGEWDLLRL